MNAPTQYGWSPATEAIMKEVDWEAASACGMARAALIAERADAEAAIGQLRAQAQLVVDDREVQVRKLNEVRELIMHDGTAAIQERFEKVMAVIGNE